jgi:hypothetical protein
VGERLTSCLCGQSVQIDIWLVMRGSCIGSGRMVGSLAAEFDGPIAQVVRAHA